MKDSNERLFIILAALWFLFMLDFVGQATFRYRIKQNHKETQQLINERFDRLIMEIDKEVFMVDTITTDTLNQSNYLYYRITFNTE